MSEEIKPQIKRTWKPIIAGSIDIIGGAYIGFLLMQFLFPLFFTGPNTIDRGDPETDWFLLPFKLLFLALFIIIALLLLVVASLPLIGGIFAIRRKAWILALAGSIILSLSPILAPLLHNMVNQSSIIWIMVILLGPTAVFLTVLSKREFE